MQDVITRRFASRCRDEIVVGTRKALDPYPRDPNSPMQVIFTDFGGPM